MRFSTLSACALAMLFVTGCNLPPDLEPLVVKRTLPLTAKGGIDMGGLSERADAPPRPDFPIALAGTIRIWNVERRDLESLGAHGAFARVLDRESARGLYATLDERVPSDACGRSELQLPDGGSATVEFTRQVAYLSRWSIALTEESLAADPSVDVARFGARLTLRSAVSTQSATGPSSFPIELAVEIAEPNGGIRSEPLDLEPGSGATIEIPLATRLTLEVADTLGADEALLIAAPDLTNLDRGIVILLEVSAPTTP